MIDDYKINVLILGSRRYYFPQSRRHSSFQHFQQEHLNSNIQSQFQFHQQDRFQQQNPLFMRSAFEWRDFANGTQSLANISQEMTAREHASNLQVKIL